MAVGIRFVFRIFHDRVHDLHARGNAAEGGVLIVKRARVALRGPVHDKELARAAVIITATARHGDNAALVGNGVVVAVQEKLALNGSRAARTVTLRISALDHKAVDHAVEGQSVIEARLHELYEVFDGDRSRLSVQLDIDHAVVLHRHADVEFSSVSARGKRKYRRAKKHRRKQKRNDFFHIYLPF